MSSERPWTWVDVDDEGTPGAVGAKRLRRHHCTSGHYPWDHWCDRAKAAGVAGDLAELGRAVMREADQHMWPEALQDECGWSDDGAAMIDLAMQDPNAASTRWAWLLETDGGHVSEFDGAEAPTR